MKTENANQKYPYPVYSLTIEEIRNMFHENGYSLIENEDVKSRNYGSNNTPFLVKNESGYLMEISIRDVNVYKGLKGVVHQSNPYLLENLELWTQINKLPFKLVKKKYFDSRYSFRKTTPLMWVCNKNNEHIWSETWEKIREYDNCPFCDGTFTTDIVESLLFRFPVLCKEVNPDKNYYDLSYIKYDSKDKLNWICPNCGNKYKKSIFQRTVKGKSCPVCEGENQVVKNSIGGEYPRLVRYWHPFRNKFSPYEIEYDGDMVVWFKCPQFGGRCGHVWSCKLSEALEKFKINDPIISKISDGAHYCPYCFRDVTEKNLDPVTEVGLNKYIYDYFSSKGIDVKREVRIGAISPKGYEMPFDIGIYNKNGNPVCLIEYQGEQHTKFVESWHKSKKGFIYQKEKDELKMKHCKEKGIPLEIIYYYEKNNINSILENIIKKFI